ncbi:vomeronasal type-2 receptor 26 [Xenopus laevis]|uniref:Vomeronasal type-2 receptor 26 n=2 Tax=Xenopus laevis TaxID=8355 RepID=A0A8J1KR14_XENLA|nr:vomeronasal type-2 receptor 26 [Xenopus laevis]
MQMNPTCHTKTLEYFTFVNDDYDEDPELTIRDDMNHGKKTCRESSQTLITPLGVTNTKNPMPCHQHRYPLHKRNLYIFPIIGSTDNPNKRTSLPLFLISYSTTDPALNDRIQFPSFYRTIPNEEAEIDGIVQILKHFGWKWVGLIISDDDTGYRAQERISTALSSYGGCLAFTVVLRDIYLRYRYTEEIVQPIRKRPAHVIVVYISTQYAYAFAFLFTRYRLPKFFWIMSSFFPRVMTYRHKEIKTTFNGSLTLLIQEGAIPGFEQFFRRFTPNRYQDDNDLTLYTWAFLFDCNLPGRVAFIPLEGEVVKDCTGNESLSDADVSVYWNLSYRVTYRVYTAVYALAHALHNLYSAQPPTNQHLNKLKSLTAKIKPWQLNKYIRNLTFTTSTGDTVFFNDNGEPPFAFDIVKCFFLPHRRVIRQKIPTSQCNEPCSPGYRKSKIEGKPLCCYDCIKCADGEMSNTTDAANCVRCTEYQKSNTERTECLLKAVNFLSYTDTMGGSFTSIALIFFITTSTVLGIFVKYWGTPIVKANNQHLSCILLISLMLCFLCTLLFIGRPTQICCLLRQVTFGIVFTISVSSILTKTLTVIIAFNATKPGSKLKKYVGTKVPIVLVIICTLGSSVISAVWMASHPPFFEADTFSEMDKVILMCNEGSVSLFFCVIGYIGTLALLSFIAAFLAKDFPDRFNEAKNITFSMLAFCSVWVTFVPAYLSSKGSRMVAVEIFAILSSSAGLLGCIFVPKCYIIFLQPELNTRTFKINPIA